MNRSLRLGEVELMVSEAGVGGRPLLLVHGFGGAKEDFADHLDALAAQGWHVVAPDHRGHGESSHPEGEDEYSLDIFAGDLLALVDELGWDRFTILGHSMGGMITQVLALEDPARIEGMVLMDTGHGAFDGVEPELLATGVAIVRERGLAEYGRILEEVGDPLENPAHERVERERAGYKEFCDRKLLASSTDMYVSMMLQLTALPDRLEQLGSLTMPTLVMVGEYDAPFLGPSRRMYDRLPDARLIVIGDAGHSPQFEAPDAWRDSIVGFLAELSGG